MGKLSHQWFTETVNMWLYCSLIYDPAGTGCLGGSRKIHKHHQGWAEAPLRFWGESTTPKTSPSEPLGCQCPALAAQHQPRRAVLELLLGQRKGQGSDSPLSLARLSVLSWGVGWGVSLTQPFPELGSKAIAGTGELSAGRVWQPVTQNPTNSWPKSSLHTNTYRHTEIIHSFIHSPTKVCWASACGLRGKWWWERWAQPCPGFLAGGKEGYPPSNSNGDWWVRGPGGSANMEAHCRWSRSGYRPGRGSLSRPTWGKAKIQAGRTQRCGGEQVQTVVKLMQKVLSVWSTRI